MKRKVLTLSLSMLIAFSIVGCGNTENSSNTNEPAPQTSEQTETSSEGAQTKPVKKGLFIKELNDKIVSIHEQFHTGYKGGDVETGATKAQNLTPDAKKLLEKFYRLRDKVKKFKGDEGPELDSLYDDFLKIKDEKAK